MRRHACFIKQTSEALQTHTGPKRTHFRSGARAPLDRGPKSAQTHTASRDTSAGQDRHHSGTIKANFHGVSKSQNSIDPAPFQTYSNITVIFLIPSKNQGDRETHEL